MGSNQSNQLRKVKAVVISDVHLGTYGCKARELNDYLRGIQPEILVLNGDIVDVWRFSKSYFPADHFMTLRIILAMMAKGTVVYFIPGNHDEALRRFAGTVAGNFHVVNKLVLTLDGQKSWIFHGDVFDVVMQNARFIAKLGASGYGFLILLNKAVNFFMKMMGQSRISLSRKIKNAVKGSGSMITKFERTVADIAISKGYQYVICGHIHRPAYKVIANSLGSVTYLNSGDWVEHFSALEYENGFWNLIVHDATTEVQVPKAGEVNFSGTEKELYAAMLNDILAD